MSSDGSPPEGERPADGTGGADAPDAGGGPDGDDPSVAELKARIDVLETENDRLRNEYVRAQQTRYRQTALGLAALGVVAAVGGLLFAQARTVLFALAGTGAFLGLLTYYLAPEQFLPASLGRAVYETLARNERTITSELGLHEDRVYVPVDPETVRLFVPQRHHYDVPDPDALADVFVVTDDDRRRGLSLAPTGEGLVEQFERAATGGLDDDPVGLATQVSDALVEQFELVESAEPDVDPAGGRATIAVSGSAFGAVDQFDHPAVSVLATAFARQLERPVTAEVQSGEDDRAPDRITVSWATDGEDDEEPNGETDEQSDGEGLDGE